MEIILLFLILGIFDRIKRIEQHIGIGPVPKKTEFIYLVFAVLAGLSVGFFGLSYFWPSMIQK